MRRTLLALALGALLLVPSLAFAQSAGGPVRVQQDPGMLTACNQFATATGAGNTSVAPSLNPGGGNYVYVCMIDIEVGANAAVTGAGVVQGCVTAGLSTNLTFSVDNSTLTAGQLKVQPYYFAQPLKTSSPGTTFTVTCSGLQSTQTVRVNLSGYFNNQ
jgi:hypothetical protein